MSVWLRRRRPHPGSPVFLGDHVHTNMIIFLIYHVFKMTAAEVKQDQNKQNPFLINGTNQITSHKLPRKLLGFGSRRLCVLAEDWGEKVWLPKGPKHVTVLAFPEHLLSGRPPLTLLNAQVTWTPGLQPPRTRTWSYPSYTDSSFFSTPATKVK